MNTFAKLAIFAAVPLALAACDSPQEDAAEATGDAIEQNAEVQADAMEDNADAVRAADPGMNSDATLNMPQGKAVTVSGTGALAKMVSKSSRLVMKWPAKWKFSKLPNSWRCQASFSNALPRSGR